MKWIKVIIIGFSIILPTFTIQADDTALQSFASGYLLGGSGATAGWEFMANNNITVTELGFWEPGLSSTSVPIGLWTESGTLLAQATVDGDSSLVDGFFYTPLLSGVPLTASQNYIIGALFESDMAMAGTTDVVTAPQVAFLENAYVYTGVLSVPTATASFQEDGYFGPNFQFQAGVPEQPSTAITGALLITPILRGMRRFRDREVRVS